MNPMMTRITLAASGVILICIGSALFIDPQAFLAMSQIFVDPDPGLMSELAAPSGVLIITGALMLLGSIKLRFANLGLTTGAVVYGSYGIGRLVSMFMHGVPNQSLVAAMLIELILAALLIVLRKTVTSMAQGNTLKTNASEVTA